jgi:hypothetical protein
MSAAKAFDYTTWPVLAYGNSHKPYAEGAQWTAWISAGGQNDAVVCHAQTKESVLALRKHILGLDKIEFLLKAIEKIEVENASRGDSDRTSELISKIKIDFEKQFKAG